MTCLCTSGPSPCEPCRTCTWCGDSPVVQVVGETRLCVGCAEFSRDDQKNVAGIW